MRALKWQPAGAATEPVTGTFDIGTMNDGARVGEERCADFEFEYGACASSRAFMAS